MVLSALDPRVQRCGFCKLEGEGLDFTCKRYEITLGRRSKTPIDVELGASSDNHTISRTHAEIKHNFERRIWELHVLGKNGVTVNGTLHTPSNMAVPLLSRDIITMGDSSFYFLLPAKRPGEPAATRPAKRERPAAPKQEPSSGRSSPKPSVASMLGHEQQGPARQLPASRPAAAPGPQPAQSPWSAPGSGNFPAHALQGWPQGDLAALQAAQQYQLKAMSQQQANSQQHQQQHQGGVHQQPQQALSQHHQAMAHQQQAVSQQQQQQQQQQGAMSHQHTAMSQQQQQQPAARLQLPRDSRELWRPQHPGRQSGSPAPQPLSSLLQSGQPQHAAAGQLPRQGSSGQSRAAAAPAPGGQQAPAHPPDLLQQHHWQQQQQQPYAQAQLPSGQPRQFHPQASHAALWQQQQQQQQQQQASQHLQQPQGQQLPQQLLAGGPEQQAQLARLQEQVRVHEQKLHEQKLRDQLLKQQAMLQYSMGQAPGQAPHSSQAAGGQHSGALQPGVMNDATSRYYELQQRLQILQAQRPAAAQSQPGSSAAPGGPASAQAPHRDSPSRAPPGFIHNADLVAAMRQTQNLHHQQTARLNGQGFQPAPGSGALHAAGSPGQHHASPASGAL